MDKNVFLLLAILGFFLHCFAQNLNEDYYRFGVKPSLIPPKLYSFNNVNEELYFGISDPGLDSTTAILQATKRAQALLALSQGVKIKNYTTGFQTEQARGNTGTYESMIDLKVTSNLIPSVKAVDTMFTSFNEAIVFITPSNEIDTNFAFSCNRYLVEYQVGGYNEYSEVIEMFLKDSKTPGEYLVYMKYGNSEDVYTQVENVVFNLPITHYSYLLPGDSIPQKYRYGLWINFMREMNVVLGSYSRLKSEQVKKMGEMYNYSAEKIDEGVSANDFTFRIRGLKFSNNEIHIELLIKNP